MVSEACWRARQGMSGVAATRAKRGGEPSGEERMTVREAVDFLRVNVFLLLATAAIGTIGALIFAVSSTPVYVARSQLMLGAASDVNVSDTQQAYDLARGQISSYAQLASSPLILRPVIEELQLDTTPTELAEQVSIEFEPGSVVMDLSVRSSSTEEATRVAQVLGQEMTTAIEQLNRLPDDRPVLTALSITPATASSEPVGPGMSTLLLLGASGGLVIGLVVAVIRRSLAYN